MTTIYMVRHAESPYVHGQERTRGLSESGHAAAERVRELLREHTIDAVVSSPYRRAVLTVEGIAEDRGLEIQLIEELRERFIVSEHDDVPWPEQEAAIERSFVQPDYALPGGESNLAASRRALPVIRELLKTYEGRAIAIGTHGNIMAIMMQAFDPGFDYAFWNSASKPDIYRLVFEGERLCEWERLWT